MDKKTLPVYGENSEKVKKIWGIKKRLAKMNSKRYKSKRYNSDYILRAKDFIQKMSNTDNCVAVSPDKSLMAVSNDNVVELWYIDTQEKLKREFVSDGRIVSLGFNKTKYEIGCVTDKSIKVWNLTSKLLIGEWDLELKNDWSWDLEFGFLKNDLDSDGCFQSDWNGEYWTFKE